MQSVSIGIVSCAYRYQLTKSPLYRVQSTDISICVLSMPDIINGSTRSPSIPPSVASLITPETYVLLNKSDMTGVEQAQISFVLDALGVQKGWVVSLATGAGTQAFLNGFAESLQER